MTEDSLIAEAFLLLGLLGLLTLFGGHRGDIVGAGQVEILQGIAAGGDFHLRELVDITLSAGGIRHSQEVAV